MNNGEIIIVRRASEHDEGHHGGAWKIAFADFMTAMMALFLVLWLINAANEETKQSVASYFNPVKLVDDRRTVKGMSESESESPREASKGFEKTDADSNETQSEKYENSQPAQNMTQDTSYFANPTQLLDSLAAEERALLTARGEMMADPGVEKDAEFADPFAPNFWQPLRVVASEGDPEARVFEKTSEEGQMGVLEGGEAEKAGPTVSDMPGPKAEPSGDGAEPVAGGPGTDEEGASVEPKASAGEDESLDGTTEGEEPAKAAADKEAGNRKAEEATANTGEKLEATAEKLEAALRQEIARDADPTDRIADAVSVTRVPNGFRISLTDNLPAAMFEVGSAVPTGPVVLALEAVGRELQKRPGRIFIHGHTDSRPMRRKDDDNWRLSTDRARSVYFMLLRGGLDDSRVTQIAGFADRRRVNADDGLDPRNRRIEILLEAQ